MATIRINLYASLRRYGGGESSVELDVSPGTTVGEVLAELGIPAGETRVLFLNHRVATTNHTLSGGERLGLFPAIGGG